MRICHHCKKELALDYFFGRQAQCPSCGADLHCCLNCTFYDENIYNNCRESQAERVVQKDRSNFCDFFQYQIATGLVALNSPAKSKLESLFKK